jgi:hypothetical protein
MRDLQQITYLTSAQVDKIKWDKCISEAANGLIYSFSFYLDHMADEWDALVMNEYEAVMPLPKRKKWNIEYLYQPFLSAQLGITGKQIDVTIIKAFLVAIPDKFRLWEIPLNYGNIYAVKGYDLYERKNFILPLNRPYSVLQENYNENTRRNIRKAQHNGCEKSSVVSINDVIELAGGIERPGSMRDMEHFRNLYHFLEKKNMASVYGIHSASNELIACCAFLYSHNRAYYVLVGNHPNGRISGASHALIDTFIKEHAGTDLTLDFEGSDIAGIAQFYKSFGGLEEKYAAIKRNKLPWYVRWMK